MPVLLAQSSRRTIPAVTLDRLHIESFQLKQKPAETTRKISVSVVGRRYGRDADGLKIFDDQVVEADTKDLDRDIVAFACARRSINPDQFMADHARAILDIDAEYKAGTLTEAKIMAYMELGMALMFELAEKYSIDGTGA